MLSNNIIDRRRATLGATNTCRLIRVLTNSRVSLVGVDGENVCVGVGVGVGGGGGGAVQSPTCAFNYKADVLPVALHVLRFC